MIQTSRRHPSEEYQKKSSRKEKINTKGKVKSQQTNAVALP